MSPASGATTVPPPSVPPPSLPPPSLPPPSGGLADTAVPDCVRACCLFQLGAAESGLADLITLAILIKRGMQNHTGDADRTGYAVNQ